MAGVGSTDELLLFSLYGVGRSHVVTGDVTFLPGVDGAGLPPVTFPAVRDTEIHHDSNRNIIIMEKHFNAILMQGVAFKSPVDKKSTNKKRS